MFGASWFSKHINLFRMLLFSLRDFILLVNSFLFLSVTNQLILINVLYFASTLPVPVRTPELSLTSRSPTDILVSWQPLTAKLSRGRVSAYRLSFRTAADEQVSTVELPVNGGNSTQYLLQDLQPDTIYLLRIEVSTRVGWSQPSAWSSHRTPKTSKATGEGIHTR